GPAEPADPLEDGLPGGRRRRGDAELEMGDANLGPFGEPVGDGGRVELEMWLLGVLGAGGEADEDLERRRVAAGRLARGQDVAVLLRPVAVGPAVPRGLPGVGEADGWRPHPRPRSRARARTSARRLR